MAFWGMSQEQILGLLRQILPVIGTVVTTLGITTPDKFGAISATILIIAGPIMIIISAIWSLITNTRSSMIAKIDTMAKDPASPVAGIIMSNTKEGKEIANNLPGVTTVVAGTSEATSIAKAT